MRIFGTAILILCFSLTAHYQYDEDENGVLDQSEFTNYLTSVFAALEHTPAFQMHGVSPRAMAEATAVQCFEDADVNPDGVLSLEEFKVSTSCFSLVRIAHW